ncbi:MAG TPA: zinc ribbon domain-containing protein [Longimicrobiales bacterium]|nr:zinc ribbon domain-containing protein [Longimicrobiales bacterium]
MKCPACGADATGAFCSRCGSRVSAAVTCRRCGDELPSDARFCTRCGAPARAGRLRAMHVVPAIAVALLALVGAWWLGRSATAPAPARAGMELTATGSPATRTPPPLTGSMREQADRLFERIMQARTRGDREEVEFFLPMGIQAYQAVDDPDPDALFHLGLLQLESRAHEHARATAARIRAADDGHLFASALAADAALAAGDTTSAKASFSVFLEDYDEQVRRALPEYELHRPALDDYHEQARRLVGA